MPRALLVATARSRGTLAAARGLARGGWSVGVGTPDGRGLAAASSVVDRSHVVPRPRDDGDEFVGALERAQRTGDYDLVFGGADDWAAALVHWRGRIPIRVAHPDALPDLLDKVTITAAAQRHGILAPRTVPATDEAVAGWEGPAVVKCRTHWNSDMANRLRIEATLADTPDAVREAVAVVRSAGHEPVLQQVVAGRLQALTGLLVDGGLRARVQQSAAGLWPTPSGVSAHAVTVPVDGDLADRTAAMLASLGWEGLVEVQFLVGRDGRPRLVDCNPRFYGSLALALAAGCNLADLWGWWLLEGTPPPDRDAPAGVTYQWLAGDLRRAWTERRGGAVRDLGRTLGRALRADAHSVLAARDLGPALVPLRARLPDG